MVYWGARRARLRPYFLRSLMRESRVRRPFWRRGFFRFSSKATKSAGDAVTNGLALG